MSRPAVRERALTWLSGTPVEGPAHRTAMAVRDRIPGALLAPERRKAREYDRMTVEIARRALVPDAVAVDAGAHEGSVLRHLTRISAAPHWAFEPVPASAARLRARFPWVHVEETALSDYDGSAQFRFLPGAAAWSSLEVRSGPENGREVRVLDVQVRRLDACIPAGTRVAFLKIDVEGAEAAVLRGAEGLLERCQPVTVFECDPGALPECVPLLAAAGLEVSLMADYLSGLRRPPAEVMRLAEQRGEYYFAAAGSPSP
jgi:FkbM family methyltransferase